MALYDPYGRPVDAIASDQNGSQQGHQNKNGDSAKDHTADNPNSPVQRPLGNDASISTKQSQSDTYDEKQYRLQKWELLVQAALCIFTALAFGSAAYYAHVANLQVGLMQQQLEATDRAWVKIARAEPIVDVVFEKARKGNDKIDVFMGAGLSAENIGRSVALSARIAARMILSGNLIAEELAQATACNSDNWGSGVQLVAEYIGPFSISPSETRQFKVFWNG